MSQVCFPALVSPTLLFQISTGFHIKGEVFTFYEVKLPPIMSRVCYLLLLCPIPLLADLRISKCMKNHMKANQIATEEDSKQVPGTVFSINLSNVIEAVDGNCVAGKNLPDIYAAQCKIVEASKDSFSNEQSFVVDFNNGRLGNQISSFASVLALAKRTGLRPMLTHRCHNDLT